VTHPAGTVFVERSNGFVGAGIRLLTRSRVNHAGIALGDGRTIEAQADGAVMGWESNGPGVIWGDGLYRAVEAQRPGAGADIAARARYLLGTPYGYTDILALALADMGVRWHWLERKVDDQHAMVCSQLADAACLGAGVHLFADGRMPSRVDPGDLEWLCADEGRGVVVEQ